MQSILQVWMRRMRYALQAIAPYLSLLLLPGGSLILIALIASKHRPTTKLSPMKSILRSTVSILMLVLGACISTHGMKGLRGATCARLARFQPVALAPQLTAHASATRVRTMAYSHPRAVTSQRTGTIIRQVGKECPIASRVEVRPNVFGEEI